MATKARRKTRRRRNPRREQQSDPLVGWIFLLGASLLAGYAVIPTLAEKIRINKLAPDVRQVYLQWLARMQDLGIKIHTGQTLRNLSQQQRLVAMGRSGTLNSWHLSGRAIDAYPYDPVTGEIDRAGKNQDLFRIMHQEWAALGGHGLAYRPYPDGPIRRITTTKDGVQRKVWDGGHLEYHGPYANATAAARAYNSAMVA